MRPPGHSFQTERLDEMDLQDKDQPKGKYLQFLRIVKTVFLRLKYVGKTSSDVDRSEFLKRHGFRNKGFLNIA